jgi:hypothetical protein
VSSGFFQNNSIINDNVAILYKEGSMVRVLLRHEDLLEAAKRAAGRNMTYGESRERFASIDYKVTFPDVPVHSSYDFTYGRIIGEHVASAERKALRGDVKGFLTEYEVALASALATSHGKSSLQYAVKCLCTGLQPLALQAAEHAVSLAPTDSEALDVLALCHATARQLDSAVQAFNEADRIATWSVFSGLRKERLDRLRRNDELPQLSVPIGEVIVPLPWSPGRKAEVLLLRGIFLASEAKRDDAAEAMKAAASWARTSGDPRVCNKVCWHGSLRGFAGEVLPAGEAAWDQSHDIKHLDTLAVARALSGDRSGAVRDLKQVVEFLNLARLEDRREYLERRSSWLRELREGRNPFDQKTLNFLLNESSD